MENLMYLWIGIILFIISMYVLLDGFDLGVGILFPFVSDESERDTMMASIAPVWDGNETWMVLGAASLYGVFPLAYSTILPYMYLPIFTMLAAFIFRGVSFEFRHKKHSHKLIWSVAFFLSSLIVTLMQGLIVGTLVQGVVGNVGFDVFSPFSITAAVGLVFGYALLGSTWLIKKTEGNLQKQMYKFCKISLVVVAFFFIIISIWVQFVHPHVYSRWFNPENFIFTIILPAIGLITTVAIIISLYREYEHAPFFLSLILFASALISQVYSVWPYVVPYKYTFQQAAANQNSMTFMLIGMAILLPVLIAYNLYAYWVFKGKVQEIHTY